MSDLKNIVGIDFSFLPCRNGQIDDCLNRERTLSYATFVNIPEDTPPSIEYDKSCCYNYEVLASLTSNLDFENDYIGFYHQRQVANEQCDFVLIENKSGNEIVLNNNDYGIYKDFGTMPNSNLKTFVLEWKKVLTQLGVGVYQVVKRNRIAGVNYETAYQNYTLSHFNSVNCDKTVRLDVNVSGLFEKIGIDFSGSGFKTALRVKGFFGRREPKYEQDNIVYRNKRSTQISNKLDNSYKFQSGLIPDFIANEIFDFFLLADDIYINDYNSNNHSVFKKVPVQLENNDGTVYFDVSTSSIINLTFNDRFKNSNKYNY